MKITNIENIHYEKPIPVYDVIKARPNHNFILACKDEVVVVHNCGML